MNDGAVTPDGPVPADRLPYREAMAELEDILVELERDTVDVDVLAAQVARAAELIRSCRARITATRLRVDEIVARLEPDPPDRPGTDDGPGGA